MSDPRYPLGKPVRDASTPAPEWVPCDDPRFERHVPTGNIRTREHAPPSAPKGSAP